MSEERQRTNVSARLGPGGIRGYGCRILPADFVFTDSGRSGGKNPRDADNAGKVA